MALRLSVRMLRSGYEADESARGEAEVVGRAGEAGEAELVGEIRG